MARGPSRGRTDTQSMAVFDCRLFSIDDRGCGMKICSDSILLGAWFLPPYSSAARVLDVGAGSGILSLMAAQVCPQAQVCGVEIDADAAAAARANFAASAWSTRLEMTEGDFMQTNFEEPFDLIISNPPYFTNGAVSPDSSRAGARHAAGLGFREVLARGARLLAPGGRLGLVSPSDAESEILFAATVAGLRLWRICRVRTSPRKPSTRILWDFGLTDGPVLAETLEMRNADGCPSEAYAALVGPFYTKIR